MKFQIQVVGLVFKMIEGKLSLLLTRSPGTEIWGLPDTPLTESETPEATLSSSIGELGVHVSYLEQLYTFADPRKGLIQMAYIVLAEPIQQKDLSPAKIKTQWASANRPKKISGSHNPIFVAGLQRLRNKISYSRIATRLLPAEFTLTELLNVYEQILDAPIDKRNFRKKVEAKKIAVPTIRFRHGVHRPARLYKRGPKTKNVPL